MKSQQTKMTSKLIQLFKDMSDLTAPECAHNCRVPHSCCSPEYCVMAFDQMVESGEKIPPETGHPTLMFMGWGGDKATGCVVPPHFRPLCTLHTCDINSLGFKKGDLKWTEDYFKLREQIEEELQ